VFDIKSAIDEIKEIMDDKVKMKNIIIINDFNSFFNQYIVKTDMKRLQ